MYIYLKFKKFNGNKDSVSLAQRDSKNNKKKVGTLITSPETMRT